MIIIPLLEMMRGKKHSFIPNYFSITTHKPIFFSNFFDPIFKLTEFKCSKRQVMVSQRTVREDNPNSLDSAY